MSKDRHPKARAIRNEYRERKNKDIADRKYQRIKDVISKNYVLEVLEYNKPIYPRTRKINEQIVTGKTSKGKAIKYSDFDNNLHYSSRDNTTLRKNIRFCRLWFNYVKLCLEVEEKQLRIQATDEPLKLDRKFYKNWDLDQIKTSTFDSWFKTHKHLFTLKPVELISDKSDISSDSFVVSIPKTSNIISVKKEIERLLKDKLKDQETTEVNFSDSKTPYISLHIEYNLLVLAFNLVPREQMLSEINDRYRHIAEAKTKKPSQAHSPDDVFSHTQSVTRKLRDGKERLKRVCDGVFP